MPTQGAYGQDQREYRLPSPPGPQLPSPTGPYTRSYDEQPYEQSYRKRPHTEPHLPVLPPPLPGSSSQAGPLPPMQGRQESADVPYSEPPAPPFAPSSPASSSTSYKSAYSQPQPQPPPQTSQPQFYPTQTAVTPRRSSPTSSYSYSSMERSSVSPNTQGPPPGPYQFPSGATLHPPLVLPSQQSRTPPPPQTQPPGSAPQQRPGMSIQNILEQGSSQSSRSATDSSMLDALMPRKF
ncbi:MAG: hypothetical protein M1839_006881 [Geoglossum umbratile]|nr:MAG: hypothetical protein M1839_006881 [Geoglossum umbratile]